MRTVFATRHGSINESIELLHQFVAGESLTTKFSHTVHNARPGCSASRPANAGVELACRGSDTFSCGWLEALTHLEREPPARTVRDERRALDSTFARLVPEPPGAYGLGLLLAREGDGPAFDFDLAGRGKAGAQPWPDATEFLRFLLAGEDRLELGRFGWQRVH